VLVLAGLNDALTPLGTPDADRLTALVRFIGFTTAIVLLALPLTGSVSALDGDARLKLGAPTVNSNGTEAVKFADVPTITTG
jgi:hypothetical protein